MEKINSLEDLKEFVEVVCDAMEVSEHLNKGEIEEAREKYYNLIKIATLNKLKESLVGYSELGDDTCKKLKTAHTRLVEQIEALKYEVKK